MRKAFKIYSKSILLQIGCECQVYDFRSRAEQTDTGQHIRIPFLQSIDDVEIYPLGDLNGLMPEAARNDINRNPRSKKKRCVGMPEPVGCDRFSDDLQGLLMQIFVESIIADILTALSLGKEEQIRADAEGDFEPLVIFPDFSNDLGKLRSDRNVPV